MDPGRRLGWPDWWPDGWPEGREPPRRLWLPGERGRLGRAGTSGHGAGVTRVTESVGKVGYGGRRSEIGKGPG